MSLKCYDPTVVKLAVVSKLNSGAPRAQYASAFVNAFYTIASPLVGNENWQKHMARELPTVLNGVLEAIAQIDGCLKEFGEIVIARNAASSIETFISRALAPDVVVPTVPIVKNRDVVVYNAQLVEDVKFNMKMFGVHENDSSFIASQVSVGFGRLVEAHHFFQQCQICFSKGQIN